MTFLKENQNICKVLFWSYFISAKLWICLLKWTYLENINVADAYKYALLQQSTLLYTFLLASNTQILHAVSEVEKIGFL